MSEKPKVTGKIGSEPPAHAPREASSLEVTTQELEQQMARVRAGVDAGVRAAPMDALPVFAPDPAAQTRLPPGVKPSDPDAVAQFRAWTAAGAPAEWPPRAPAEWPVPRGTAEAVPAAAISAENSQKSAENPKNRPDPATELVGSDAIAAVEAAFQALRGERSAPVAAPEVSGAPVVAPAPHQPAASDSESPSRGIPKANLPPDKQITGGFGVAAAAAGGEYIGLDGSELCTLFQAMLIDIVERLPRDIRLSMAVRYPRVKARVEFIVESYASDTDFVITRVFPEPKTQTPLELARKLADEVVFVIANQRQEFDAAGKAETPANAIRQELGLEIPHKQIIQTPTGNTVVDVRS